MLSDQQDMGDAEEEEEQDEEKEEETEERDEEVWFTLTFLQGFNMGGYNFA